MSTPRRVITGHTEATVKALAARLQELGISAEEARFRSELAGLRDSFSVIVEGGADVKAAVDAVLAEFPGEDLDVLDVEVSALAADALPEDWAERDFLETFPVVVTAEMTVEVGARAAFVGEVTELAAAIGAEVEEVHPADARPAHRSRTFSAILSVIGDDAEDAVERVRRRLDGFRMHRWVEADSAE